MKDYYGDDIKTYIIEVVLNDEVRYVRTKNVAIHFKDSARKFAHKRSAVRFFKDSVFNNLSCSYRIIEL
jgi:hypothetical protein